MRLFYSPQGTAPLPLVPPCPMHSNDFSLEAWRQQPQAIIHFSLLWTHPAVRPLHRPYTRSCPALKYISLIIIRPFQSVSPFDRVDIDCGPGVERRRATPCHCVDKKKTGTDSSRCGTISGDKIFRKTRCHETSSILSTH